MSKFSTLHDRFLVNLVGGLLLNILIQGVCATNSISSKSPLSATSCGGILETNSGSLKHGGKHGYASHCLWIIKLPATLANRLRIRFQLEQIPQSGQLSLYPQDEYVAGQLTILPIGLSSANESSVIETSGSTMIVVWNAGELAETSSPLVFRWDSIRHPQKVGKGPENGLLGGVGYADESTGSFSWEKPGEYQESLLWVLNSKSGNLMDLQTEMELERCDLADRCLCSYFGVYEVLENSLEAVATNCGRSSSLNFEGVQSTLVVFTFVNPAIRRDSNHITLTWESSQSHETTTTTTSKTTLTTKSAETTTTVTTEQPPIADLCPAAKMISPCMCGVSGIDCRGSSVVQESINRLMTELRLVNGLTPEQVFFTTKFLYIQDASMISFDLTPILNSRFSEIAIFGETENTNLASIHGPLSPSPSSLAPGRLGKDEAANQYFASIDTDRLFLERNNLTDAGLADCFHYFSPSLEELYLGSNPIQGPSTFNRNKLKENGFTEFLPGISNFNNLQVFYLPAVRVLERAPFKALGSLTQLFLNCVVEIREAAFLMEENRTNSAVERTIEMLFCNRLSDDNFHVNHGLQLWKGKTQLDFRNNNFEFLSQEKFEPFLQINEANSMDLTGNPFICDQRMKWLKDGRKSYEGRVFKVACTNDPGHTIFTTDLV